jgi:hypothetical protein
MYLLSSLAGVGVILHRPVFLLLDKYSAGTMLEIIQGNSEQSKYLKKNNRI